MSATVQPIPESPGRVWATFKSTIFVVGMIFSCVSVMNYYDVYTQLGASGVIEKWLISYRWALDQSIGRLEQPLREILLYISTLTGIHLTLPPYWKELSVLAGLYFLNDASANWRPGRRLYAAFLVAWGSAVALLFGVTSDPSNRLPDLAVFVVLLTLYEAGSDLYYAATLRILGRTLWHEFMFQFNLRALTNILLGVGLVFVGTYYSFPGGNGLLLIIYVLILAGRDIVSSFYLSYRNLRGIPGTWFQRARRSGPWRLGQNVIVTIVAATVGILIGGSI